MHGASTDRLAGWFGCIVKLGLTVVLVTAHSNRGVRMAAVHNQAPFAPCLNPQAAGEGAQAAGATAAAAGGAAGGRGGRPQGSRGSSQGPPSAAGYPNTDAGAVTPQGSRAGGEAACSGAGHAVGGSLHAACACSRGAGPPCDRLSAQEGGVELACLEWVEGFCVGSCGPMLLSVC